MLFKNLDNKMRAYATLILLIAIAAAFWYFSDDFAVWSSQANPWLVMVVSIIINPAYLVLIYTLYHQYNFRGLISGIIISIGIDVISLSHSINRLGVMPTDPALFAYSDTTFYKLINPFIHGPIAVFILYVVIPGLLFYLALRIIRRSASFNKIIKESI